MLKVVIFNSPPRLGKGVAAKDMIEQTNTEDTLFTAHHREFKDSLFELTAAMYGISVEDFLKDYDAPCEGSPTGWVKDLNTASINFVGSVPDDDNKISLSQRSSLIHMSENIIKPVFGKDAFGKALVESLPESGIVFISDGGFKEEVQPVIDYVGEENLLIVRINREGVGFEGDSRRYLTEDDFPNNSVNIIDIRNDDTLESFLQNVRTTIKEWLNE